MEVKSLEEYTVTELVSDITYCDGCKIPLAMNLAIKGRSERIKSAKSHTVRYFKVHNYTGAYGYDVETSHYCINCVQKCLTKILDDPYNIDIEIESSSGMVIDGEIE